MDPTVKIESIIRRIKSHWSDACPVLWPTVINKQTQKIMDREIFFWESLLENP